METRSTTKRKRIKKESIEDLEVRVQDIVCPQEILDIITNKKIKVEYDDD